MPSLSDRALNIFLTSLMHPQTALDYSRVEATFAKTAQSVCSQTNQDFKFVVVCNAIPKLANKHPNVSYHVVDFPPATSGTDKTSRRLDKATKIVAGLLSLRADTPTYVHIIDADDWVSRHLLSTLHSLAPHPTGWYISHGYSADLSALRIQAKHGLDRYCGSTFISNYTSLMDMLKLDPQLDENSNQEDILAAVPTSTLLEIINAHGYHALSSRFERSYALYPAQGIVWVRNTGEHILSDVVRDEGLPIADRHLAEFGVSGLVSTNAMQSRLRGRLQHKVTQLVSFTGWTIDRLRRGLRRHCANAPENLR
jgi:hypothetical protein